MNTNIPATTKTDRAIVPKRDPIHVVNPLEDFDGDALEGIKCFILDRIPREEAGEVRSGGKDPSPSHTCGDRHLHVPLMISAMNGFAGSSDEAE